MLKSKQTNAWLGIRNKVGARNIPDHAVHDAVDVSLTDAGGFLRKPGQQLARPAPVSAVHETKGGDVYVISEGRLKRILDDLSFVDICPSTATAFCDKDGYLWTNDGLEVFGDQAKGIRLPTPAEPAVTAVPGDLPPGLYSAVVTNVDPRTGMMSGTSRIVTVENPGGLLVVPSFDPGYVPVVWTTRAAKKGQGTGTFYDEFGGALPEHYLNADSFPDSPRLIEWHDSRLMATRDHAGHTGIYWSARNFYHLWDEAKGFVVVPGRVLDMKSAGPALVLATADAIYATSDLKRLEVLAHYGVPSGNSMAVHPDNGLVYIDSKRGTCVAVPFQNLTDAKCSLDPGNRCQVQFVHQDGMQQFIALHDGGARPFNRFGQAPAATPPVAPTETFYLTDGLGNVLTDALGNRLTWN